MAAPQDGDFGEALAEKIKIRESPTEQQQSWGAQDHPIISRQPHPLSMRDNVPYYLLPWPPAHHEVLCLLSSVLVIRSRSGKARSHDASTWLLAPCSFFGSSLILQLTTTIRFEQHALRTQTLHFAAESTAIPRGIANIDALVADSSDCHARLSWHTFSGMMRSGLRHVSWRQWLPSKGILSLPPTVSQRALIRHPDEVKTRPAEELPPSFRRRPSQLDATALVISLLK
jgi:hypothetical protein